MTMGAGGRLIIDGCYRCIGSVLTRVPQQQRPAGLWLGSVARRPGRGISLMWSSLLQSRRSVASVSEAGAAGDSQAGPAPLGEKMWAERLLAPTPPDEMTLMDAPQNVIVSALMEMRHPRGWSFFGQEINRHERIVQLVRHLVRGRGQAPNLFMYECLMDAMSDPQGSVSGVRELLEDMESQSIKPTGAICRAALTALANHPDYTTRLEIVQIMHNYWFPLDVGARQSLLLGLLRDEQYEMAYTRLTEMLGQKTRIESWVLDIFILVFAKLGFLDEMLMLLLQRRKRSEEPDEVMISLLYQALDSCSQAFHHRGTTYAWTALVKNSTIQPPDGILDNVLSTASRHGDAVLATEVLDLISRRAWVLPHHYEAVAEAFSQSGNVIGAIRILCIMKKSGTSILREHTRSIKAAMKCEAMPAEKVEEELRKLATEETLPLPAVSALVEVAAEMYGSEKWMELYRDMESLCGQKAEGITVMWLIIYAKSDETRRELAKDYKATISLALETEHKGGTGLYKLLIPACARAGELDLAFRFAKQAIPGSKTGAYLGWVRPLMECAAAHKDERIWAVVNKLKERRDPTTASMLQTMLHETRQAIQEAGWAARVDAATATAESESKSAPKTATSAPAIGTATRTDHTLRLEKERHVSDLDLPRDPDSPPPI